MAKVIQEKDVNKDNSKVEFVNSWIVPIVFLVFTVLFLFAFVYMVVLQCSRSRYYEDVEAEVVSIADYTDREGEDHYEVYVRYYVDGEKYKQKLTYWNEELEVGDTTIIQYDIRNPLVIKTVNTFAWLIVVEFVMFAGLLTITIFLFVRKYRLVRKSIGVLVAGSEIDSDEKSSVSQEIKGK